MIEQIILEALEANAGKCLDTPEERQDIANSILSALLADSWRVVESLAKNFIEEIADVLDGDDEADDQESAA